LVFIFITEGHWEAVGFLITAKSVFRFSDLKESKDRKLTEYILIGTLMSFGIAIITALDDTIRNGAGIISIIILHKKREVNC